MDASTKRHCPRDGRSFCKRHGIKFHLLLLPYRLDRDDYPGGWSAKNAEAMPRKADFDSYFHFYEEPNHGINPEIRPSMPSGLIWKWDQPSSLRLAPRRTIIHPDPQSSSPPASSETTTTEARCREGLPTVRARPAEKHSRVFRRTRNRPNPRWKHARP